MRRSLPWVSLAMGCAVLGVASWLAHAGDLNPPPGPVQPTMKTLTEVEPRIAVQTLAGDAEAVHVIGTAGSYYLTANITGQAGKHGIKIMAHGVTLDLNGFALIGVPGSQHGVFVSAPGYTNVSVRNGSVRSWAGAGLHCENTSNCRIDGVLAADNGTGGNGSGILVGSSSSVVRCSSRGNGTRGIVGQRSVLVEGCTVESNASHGIDVSGESLIVNCTVKGNAGVAGILVGYSCTVTGCVVSSNVGSGDFGNGILVNGSENRIENNLCVSNQTAGIRVQGQGNRLEANHVQSNARGFHVTAPGSLIIRNSAQWNSIKNYEVVPDNTFGPIVNKDNVATSCNPHANYEP